MERAFKIMESYRKKLNLDNKAWMEEHKENLFPYDLEKTYNYVERNHPNQWISFLLF